MNLNVRSKTSVSRGQRLGINRNNVDADFSGNAFYFYTYFPMYSPRTREYYYYTENVLKSTIFERRFSCTNATHIYIHVMRLCHWPNTDVYRALYFVRPFFENRTWNDAIRCPKPIVVVRLSVVSRDGFSDAPTRRGGKRCRRFRPRRTRGPPWFESSPLSLIGVCPGVGVRGRNAVWLITNAQTLCRPSLIIRRVPPHRRYLAGPTTPNAPVRRAFTTVSRLLLQHRILWRRSSRLRWPATPVCTRHSVIGRIGFVNEKNK